MNEPEYNAWVNMKQRCYNENHPEYFRYGERGITVCEDWLHSYSNFINDMGKRPLRYVFVRSERQRWSLL